MNLCCRLHVSLAFSTKFTQFVIIKIFVINLLKWLRPWNPHLSSQQPSWVAQTLLWLGCFGLDFTSLCTCHHIYCDTGILSSLNACYNSLHRQQYWVLLLYYVHVLYLKFNDAIHAGCQIASSLAELSSQWFSPSWAVY